jgi:hypothetical protein
MSGGAFELYRIPEVCFGGPTPRAKYPAVPGCDPAPSPMQLIAAGQVREHRFHFHVHFRGNPSTQRPGANSVII